MLKKALVLTNHLHSFAGSEIVAIEIAEQLSDLNFLVEIRVNALSSRVTGSVNKAVTISDSVHDINWNTYDVIWAQHDLLSHSLLHKLKADARLFSAHLSPYHFREHLGIYAALLRGATFVVNSEETYLSLSTQIPPAARIINLRNACPKDWFSEGEGDASFTELAIISNHPPEEVIDAAILLRKRGIRVKIFGKGHEYRRLRPSDLEKASAILTIGKSVQYSIASNRPVFVYDHFGGPGWLNPSNFQVAEKFNFSGRCCAKKITKEQLANDLFYGYEQAKMDLSIIREQNLKNYDLRAVLTKEFLATGRQNLSANMGKVSAEALIYYASLSRERYRRSHLRNVINGKFIRLKEILSRLFLRLK